MKEGSGKKLNCSRLIAELRLEPGAFLLQRPPSLLYTHKSKDSVSWPNWKLEWGWGEGWGEEKIRALALIWWEPTCLRLSGSSFPCNLLLGVVDCPSANPGALLWVHSSCLLSAPPAGWENEKVFITGFYFTYVLFRWVRNGNGSRGKYQARREEIGNMADKTLADPLPIS